MGASAAASVASVDRDRVMRRALWTSCVANLVAAGGFAFPDTLGRLAGFPGGGPRLYTTTLAVLVALFGLTYGWLASQPRIDRPLVVFSAIGKTSFVAVAFGCWLLGEVTGQGMLMASGDLVFAAIFAWWLVGDAAAER
jgi:hypothetical protein